MLATVALLTALSAEDGWPVSQRVVDELMRMGGDHLGRLAHTLHEAGETEMCLKAIDAGSFKVPQRMLSHYRRKRDTGAIIELLMRYQGKLREDLPVPIELFFIRRDRAAFERACEYFTGTLSSGAPFVASEYVQGWVYSDRPELAFCELLFHEELVPESLEAAERLLSGTDLETFLWTVAAFKHDKFGADVLAVVKRREASMSPRFLATLYRVFPSKEVFKLAIRHVHRADWFASENANDNYEDASTLQHLFYGLQKSGFEEDADRLLREFWPRMRPAIEGLERDLLMWCGLYDRMGEREAMRARTERLIEKARDTSDPDARPQERLNMANWVYRVYEDREGMRRVLHDAVLLAPGLAADLHFDWALDMSDSDPVAALGYVERHIDLRMFDAVVKITERLRDAIGDERAAEFAKKGFQQLIDRGRPQIDTGAYLLLNKLGLNSLAADLVRLAFEVHLSPNVAETAFLLQGAIGEDAKASESISVAIQNAYGCFVLLTWEDLTKRELTDLLSLDGKDVFAILRRAVTASDQHKAATALYLFTKLYHENHEGSLGEVLLECIGACLPRLEPDSRAYYEAETLLEMIDGRPATSLEAQERLLETIQRARKPGYENASLF